MRLRASLSAFVCLCIAALSITATAQVDPVRFAAIKKRLQQVADTYHKFPATTQQMMDGTANAAYLSTVVNRLQPQVLQRATGSRAAMVKTLTKAAVLAAGTTGPVQVSDPSVDVDFSSSGGFTQSETSTGLCGNNAVVGFNDSGSYADTLLNGTGGVSFSGVAVSHNRGTTFTDLGPVPAGANINNFLLGDPIIGCSNASTLYYSQLFQTCTDLACNHPFSGVAISTSNDGGNTWSDPKGALLKNAFYHSIDKDWMVVDPSNPKNIYISYTDFDYTGFQFPVPPGTPCPNNIRIGIEVVASNDGGNTWGKPIVVDHICSFSDALQGSHLAVDSHGKVYIAWVHCINFPIGERDIRVTSLVQGATKLKAAPYVTATGITGPGDTFYLQGEFRDFLGIDFAVDTSGTFSDGTLYLTWDDGRDKTLPDAFSTNGSYSFADILASASFDGGVSWSYFPVKINADNQPRGGYGHDHYQPGMAVDSKGSLAICWYDRGTDPLNFVSSRYCAESVNGGAFTNFKVNITSFAPVHSTDVFINPVYQGDYDGLSTDFTKGTSGFIGSFQVMGDKSDPDVQAFSFQ
jgi:hypothetical protein